MVIATMFSKKFALPPYKALCHAFKHWNNICLNIQSQPIEMHRNELYIITINHQAFRDVALIMGALAAHHIYPRFIMKDSIRHYPVFGTIANRAGYLPINRDKPKETLRRIQASVTTESLLTNWTFFPEGTRAPFGHIHHPKHAGLQWLYASYPHHTWVDFTLVYHNSTVHIYASHPEAPSKTHSLKQILNKTWEAKEALGLINIDNQSS